VAAYGDHYKVLALSNDLGPLAHEALRLTDGGDLDRARQLLDFAVAGASLGTADEPLSGSPLARLWTKGTQASAREVRIAAAALAAAAGNPEATVAPLTDCQTRPPSDGAGTACAAALLSAYERLERFTQGAALAADLARRFPQSKRAFFAQVSLVRKLRHDPEARALLEARAAREPDDPDIKGALVDLLMEAGDIARGEAALKDLAKSGAAPAMVYNLTAWLRIVRGQLDGDTLSTAQRAVESSQRHSAAILHTLAAAQAEMNRPEEAYHTLLEELERRNGDGLVGAEWYVVGRIAECYGAVDAAREAYAKVERPKPLSPLDTWNLVDRRLRALGPDRPTTKK
jgi:thioredoxin-like negative regulator of GroEL